MTDRPTTEPRRVFDYLDREGVLFFTDDGHRQRVIDGLAEAAQGAAPPSGGWKTPGDPSIDGTDFGWDDLAAPHEGPDRIYAAMEKGAATAWDEWHERRAAPRSAAEAVCAYGHAFVTHTGKPVEDCPMYEDHARLAAAVLAAPRAEGLDVERLAEWFHNKWEAQGIACWHKNQHIRSWDCGRDAIEAAEYVRRLSCV